MEKQINISKEELKELQKFKKLYGTEKDHQEVVDFFYKVFLYAFINGNKDVIFFVKRFNEIKLQDSNFYLSRERKCERMSLYDPVFKKIYVHKDKIEHHDQTIVFHEGMHLFHEYSSLHSHEPIEYEKQRMNTIDRILQHKESILRELQKISEKYDEISNKAVKYIYENYIYKIGAKNVADYIDKEKEKYNDLIQQKDIYNKLVEMGFNQENCKILNSKNDDHELTSSELLDTLIQQKYQDKISEFSVAIEPEEIAYEGFISAILLGEQEEWMIKYGHSKEYFQMDKENGFKEVLAHYSELKNSSSNKKWLDILKNQLGEEFLNYIDRIYLQILTNPYHLSLESENKMGI
ncbi:MAG: hypothetical protein IJ743_02845 [Bacilli bacterium]|nr:hypothetical protein [Bacilli bacterium]MBR1817796.1 hypothetical protein [Bacilli bacterium]